MSDHRANPNHSRGPWCTVCNIEKKRDNHWFKVSCEEAGLFIMEIADERPGDPVCGEACLQKLVAEWADSKRIMSERVRALTLW